MDVGLLHQVAALSPFLFIMVTGILTYKVRKAVPEKIMFAEDVILSGGNEVDMTEYHGERRRKIGEWESAEQKHNGWNVGSNKLKG